jgi:hypothetical protein
MPQETKTATVIFTQAVRVTVNDPAVLERWTGPEGDEMRAQHYDLRNLRTVLAHLAYNCVANGVTNAKLLDGWADLPKNAVSMEPIGDFELQEV